MQHNCDYCQCWVTNHVYCVGCGPDLVQCCHCHQTCESNQSHHHLGCWRMYTNPYRNCTNLHNFVLAVINFIHIIRLQNTKLCNAKSINKSAAPGHVIIHGLKVPPPPFYLLLVLETGNTSYHPWVSNLVFYTQSVIAVILPLKLHQS